VFSRWRKCAGVRANVIGKAVKAERAEHHMIHQTDDLLMRNIMVTPSLNSLFMLCLA
jgi:hypothetical protein